MQLIFNHDPSKSEEMPMAMGDRVDQEDAVARMSYAEQLLVWSWRKIVRGDGGCPLIAREFSRLCGDDACEVLATFTRSCKHYRTAGAGISRSDIPAAPSSQATNSECSA
jgi:hypothetical protein